MSKKILIVEEALLDQKAHWYSYIYTISEAAAKKGWEVDVACNINADSNVKESYSSFPLFDYSVYLDNERDKLPGEKYYSFILHSLRSIRVVWPFLKKRPVYDEIFVPTVLVQHLLAWLIIMLFHPKKPKRLTLFFVTNPGVWKKETQKSGIPISSYLVKYLITLFKNLVKKNSVKLAVETRLAKEEFESLTNIRFHLFPHPVQFDNYPFKVQHSNELLFSCFGFARHEKGSDLLKTAIEKFLTERSLHIAKFIIQWTDSFKMPDGSVCSPGNLLTGNSRVSLITTPLNNDEYQSLLKSSDCMVLPYRNSSYYARVSRVAIEAACYGIPMIYTKGGWLEEMVTEYGAGIGIKDESVEQIFEAINNMALNIIEYKESAAKKLLHARQYFSPVNFIEQLVE